MKKVFMFILLVISILFSQKKTYSNFTLPDVYGKYHSLVDFKNAKAIVIIFISTRCPVSNDYNSRMQKIYLDYKDKGITVIGINSNKEENEEEIIKHSKENNLSFLILKDWGNKIADIFEASFTPEVFVLSPKFELLYHGRIDDSRKINNVKENDLRTALDEILSNKEVTKKETKAFGCTIKRVKYDKQ